MARELDIADLYRRYGDLVVGRCRTLLRNDSDAQDAAQEVFLKAHRYKDDFRGDSSPSTWLFRITTTTCLNWIRTRKRRPEDPVEDFASSPFQPYQDSMLSQIALRQLVNLVLQQEDERTRDCVVYFYADGMTHDEIGELLGLSGAAVRKRISTFRNSIQGNPPPWLREVT